MHGDPILNRVNTSKTAATYWEQIGGKFSEHSSKQKFSGNLVKKSTPCVVDEDMMTLGYKLVTRLLLKRKCCS